MTCHKALNLAQTNMTKKFKLVKFEETTYSNILNQTINATFKYQVSQ